ncbi:MAG: CotH kinase family protein [Polyangiales bacterium]
MSTPFAGIACAVVLVHGASASRARADCDAPFDDPTDVLDFHVSIAHDDWRALLASAIPNADAQPTDSPACSASFPKFAARFRCGEGAWRDVTVRKKKGEERGVEAFEKPPLKIDFTPTGIAQGFPDALGALAYQTLTLNNGQSNKYRDTLAVLPVLHAEHVALRLLGDADPLTPRSAYATLTVHVDGAAQGAYHGVYVLVEDIDRAALQRRGLSGTGRLEKASTYNCSPEVEFEDDGENAAKAGFDAFLAEATRTPAAPAGELAALASRAIALDEVLQQEAAREILVNGSDTLFNSANPPGLGNNWFAYDPPEGPRRYLPWDLDLAFGQQAGACQPTPLQCPSSVPVLAYCDGPGGSPASPYAQTTSQLGLSLACNPALRPRYLALMCALTQGPFAAARVLDVWHETYATLAGLVPREAATVWRGIDPLAAPTRPDVIETFGSEYRRLAAWIPARIAFVQAEITRLGVACPAAR